MNASLHALAAIYRQSSAAKSGVVKDYTLDWETFLRRTNRHDGDARELAEQELLAAGRASGGLFVIECNRRTGARELLRLKRDGGEAWLFSSIGSLSPAQEREELVGFFRQAAEMPVPECHAGGWRAWCEALAVAAREGGSVSPFMDGDAAGDARFLTTLARVLGWREESLVRYASMVICRDSKTLEALQPRLLSALRKITGRKEVSLEDFGISDKPRSVLIHGPLALELPGGRIDFGVLSGPVSVSATDLVEALDVNCGSKVCLTVENESVFLELAKRRTGVLLVHTSFPGAATRLLFERLPADLECHHFGDSDPAGFDILRDLREKTGREFQPVMMKFRAFPGAPHLTDDERKVTARLLGSDAIKDVHGELRAMLDAGSKGDFEQESVELSGVVEALRG